MKPKLYLMLLLICSLLGILGITKVKYSANREREFNGILIKVDATGADAFKVEEIVTTPIEKSLSSVGGINEIRSISEVGKANIFLRFKDTIDFRSISLEIREKLDLVSANFPKEFHKPHILRYDPLQKPIYIASFESKTLSINDLRLYLETTIKPSLSTIEGVNLIEIAGGELEEIQVSCDPFQLESYKISLLEVLNRIQDVNKNYLLGHSNSFNRENTISLNSKYENIYDIQKTPIIVKENGKGIYIKDVCSVETKPRDSSIVSRINGTEKASIFIYGSSESSIILLSGQIESLIQKYLRNDVQYNVHTDLSRDLYLRLKYFFILLLFLALFFSLRLKIKFNILFSKKVLTISILSFTFVTFITILFKLKVTEVSLTAFLLCLVLYFILFSKKKITTNIIIKFLIIHTILFFCFFFLYNLIDRILEKEMIEFYSIFILTLLSLTFFSRDIDFGSQKELLFKKHIRINSDFFVAIIQKIKNKAKTKLMPSNSKYLDNFYLFPVSIFFLIILGVFFYVNTDFSSKIESEGYEISAILEFPAGTSFEYANRITKETEDKLKKNSDIDEIISKVESERSFLIIKFKDNLKIDKQLLSSLKRSAGNLEDAYLHFINDIETPLLNEFQYDAVGPDLNILESLVSQISKRLKEEEGIDDVLLKFKPSREEMELLYRGDKFIHSGISISEFGEQLRTAIQGGIASKLFEGNKEIDIRVRYDESFRKSVRDLNLYKVKNIFKGFVPIEQIIEIKIKKIPSKIYHKDRIRSLSFAVQTDLPISEINKTLDALLLELNFDINYRISEYKNIENTQIRDIVLRIFFLCIFIALIVSDYLKFRNLNSLTVYSEIIYFFPYFFILIYFHQSNFALYLQIGFLSGLSLTRSLGKLVLTKKFTKELFLITLLINLIVPPIFYSLALVLNSTFIYILGKRYYLQTSHRWMLGNSLQSIGDLYSRIRIDLKNLEVKLNSKKKNPP